MPREKRRYKRFYVTGSAIIQTKNKKNGFTFETTVANISKTGLGVYSKKPIEKDTPVSVKLSFFSEDGHERTDQLEGSVVTSSKIGNFYFIGIAFDRELTEDSHPILFKHFWKIIGWY